MESQYFFSESTTFATNEILPLDLEEQHKPTFIHDLESLVKMIFINPFANNPYGPILSGIKEDFDKLLSFWEEMKISFSTKSIQTKM